MKVENYRARFPADPMHQHDAPLPHTRRLARDRSREMTRYRSSSVGNASEQWIRARFSHQQSATWRCQVALMSADRARDVSSIRCFVEILRLTLGYRAIQSTNALEIGLRPAPSTRTPSTPTPRTRAAPTRTKYARQVRQVLAAKYARCLLGVTTRAGFFSQKQDSFRRRSCAAPLYRPP